MATSKAGKVDVLQHFFKRHGKESVTEDQIEEIIDLRYPDRTLIFDPEDTSAMIDVLALFKYLSYEVVMTFLRSIANESKMVLESPLLEDARQAVKDKREILSRDPVGAEKVLGKCFRCGYNKLLLTSVQTRSGDESMTNFYFCTQCKNMWRS